MIKVNAAKTVGDAIDPKHEIEVVCSHCGYDLDETELSADTCADCGETLNLRQKYKDLRDKRPCCRWQYTSIGFEDDYSGGAKRTTEL